MNAPMPAAGPGARASFVVVAGPVVAPATPAASDTASLAADAPDLAEAALHAAAAAAPLAVGSLLIALASALLLFHASAWRVGWAIAAAAALGAMAALGIAGANPRATPALLRASRSGYARLGLVAPLLFASAPWLPGPGEAAAARSLFVLALGMAAIGGAAAFASMRTPAAFAASMPLSPALAEWWGAEEAATALPGDAFAGALIAGVALVVGVACRRNWLRDARAAIADSARMRALEAARDAALRADRESRHVIAMASRDLRQPVNALALFAAALEQRLRESGDESLLRNLVHSVDGLDRSFGALLAQSRLDTPGERFALDVVFRRLATRFDGDAAQCGLRLRFAGGAKVALGDPALLEELLAQLLHGALHGTARGGVAVVVRRTAAHLNVEVWDTGAGLPSGELPRLFDEAPGAALAAARRLAQRLGCRLTVASRPGHGTLFRVGLAPGDTCAPPVGGIGVPPVSSRPRDTIGALIGRWFGATMTAGAAVRRRGFAWRRAGRIRRLRH